MSLGSLLLYILGRVCGIVVFPFKVPFIIAGRVSKSWDNPDPSGVEVDRKPWYPPPMTPAAEVQAGDTKKERITMLTPPFGVQQILTTTAPGGQIQQTLIPVTQPNWKKFCMLSDANAMLNQMLAISPGATLEVAEGLQEEALMYVFASTINSASPRVWMIQGTLADGSVVGEYAGWLIDRKKCPQSFIDNTSGNVADNVLAFTDEYGYAQYYYAAGPATSAAATVVVKGTGVA